MSLAPRSFNPALQKVFKGILPRFQYGFKHLAHPLSIQKVIDKLDLKSKYPNGSKLDIIDINSSYGLFSAMVNYELKPRKHVIIEAGLENKKLWEDRIELLEETTQNAENFVLYPHSGYEWSTYQDLITRDKIVSPTIQSRDKIHDELLIIANSSVPSYGESLFAQWIMCCLYRNWLQKYGKVRMVCCIPDLTAMKFFLLQGFSKRNKSAVKLDLFTKSKLIAITSNVDPRAPDGEGYDPRRILQDDPVLVPCEHTIPQNKACAIVEIVPTDYGLKKVDYIDHVIKSLYFHGAHKVAGSLQYLGPAAYEDLSPVLSPEILEKTSRQLTFEEWDSIITAFLNWPFKPTAEEVLDIVKGDARES